MLNDVVKWVVVVFGFEVLVLDLVFYYNNVMVGFFIFNGIFFMIVILRVGVFVLFFNDGLFV